MDQNQDHGSGGSSCPGSHANDDDDGNKKAKTSTTAASSSASTTSHDDHASLPPPPVLLCFHSLPDIAHDVIASYLITHDMHRMMECDQWRLKAYGGRIKSLTIPSIINGNDPSTLATTMLSLLGRRPGLSHVITSMDKRVEVLVEAMRRGYLNNLRGLKVEDRGVMYDEEEAILKGVSIFALCDAWADGVCPKINALEVTLDGDETLLGTLLNNAMRSRMEEGKGCCGLKSLRIQGRGYTNTLCVGSSGACEALEELNIIEESMSAETASDLSEWLFRTKAPNLQILKLSYTPPNVVAALCSSDVAPSLQTLHLTVKDATSISFLTQAIGSGAWLTLSDLKLGIFQKLDGNQQADAAANENARRAVPGLMEAIGQGAPQLKVLSSGFSEIFGREGGIAVARMLGDGGCPQLQELDLKGSNVDDDAMVELARALEGGAPCNTTLRRLDLQYNDIGGAGVRALMEAMEGGALPHLHHLDLSGNRLIKDNGVAALAMAMTTRRVLSSLQTLGLGYVGMTEIGALALFDAFRHHKPCPHLKTLKISHNREIGDGGVVQLAKAIEAGAFHYLGKLDIQQIGMTGEGFRALVKATVAQHPNPGSPRLEVLNVTSNDLGNEGVMYLAEAIKVKGAMQYLRKMHLNRVAVGDVGAMALLDALTQSHVCPNLQSVNMYSEYYGNIAALQQSIKAIRSGLVITTE